MIKGMLFAGFAMAIVYAYNSDNATNDTLSSTSSPTEFMQLRVR